MKLKRIAAYALVLITSTVAMGVNAQSAGPSGSPTPPGRNELKPTAPSVAGESPEASSARPNDKTLRRQVKAALKRTHGLNASNIAVRAKEGVVTLQGTVPDQKSIDLAVNTARGVVGVTSVTNTLSVSRATNSWR
nr:BON domain-containing protein [Burkholderia ambifaria]